MRNGMSHPCPLCHAEVIPTYRAMCRTCFDRVPWRSRAELLKRWRLRVLDNAAYQEELAVARRCYIESHLPERTKDIEPQE